ncbi:MAG: hypothetical protein P4L10_01125 [Acidobacteriaceae bacterium]|nr:hypothetical protein [Acidobacteriaceae bacterium]
MFQKEYPQPAMLPHEQKEAVRIQLGQILQSEFFHGSRKCCRFLEYAVDQVLQGRPQEEVKERTVGMEVFDRPPDYDTAQDNIVRGTANEVRKRLAQYYGKPDSGNTLIIGLPSGSYVATLEWSPNLAVESTPALDSQLPQHQEPAEVHTPSRFRFFGKAIAAALVVGAITLIAFRYEVSRREDPIRRVWLAFQESDKPVLVCVAQPLAYIEHTAANPSASSEFIPLPKAFVGVGDAYALADIAELLSTRPKHWHLVAGNETPSQDLKLGPVILIGAFSNPWTLRMTENLRFTYATGDVIHDRLQPGRQWSLSNAHFYWKAQEDFAVVSRFQSPETGQPLIVVAGLTSLGTEAAGEFLTDRDLLGSALREAPKDWKGENFQFVLHTKLIGETPERPTVVASYFW